MTRVMRIGSRGGGISTAAPAADGSSDFMLPYLLRTAAVFFRRCAKIGKFTPQLNWLLESSWTLLEEVEKLLVGDSRRVSTHPHALLLARALAAQSVPTDVPSLRRDLRHTLEAVGEGKFSSTDLRRMATLLENVAATLERSAA